MAKTRHYEVLEIQPDGQHRGAGGGHMTAPIEMRKAEEISDALRRLQRRLGIRTQGEMAGQLHMTESTYKRRLRNPHELTVGDLWQIERVARRANMEIPEVRLHV